MWIDILTGYSFFWAFERSENSILHRLLGFSFLGFEWNEKALLLVWPSCVLFRWTKPIETIHGNLKKHFLLALQVKRECPIFGVSFIGIRATARMPYCSAFSRKSFFFARLLAELSILMAQKLLLKHGIGTVIELFPRTFKGFSDGEKISFARTYQSKEKLPMIFTTLSQIKKGEKDWIHILAPGRCH